MHTYNLPEARRYKRIENTCFTRFQYRPENDTGFREAEMADVINLSAGGVFLHSNNDLEIGTVLNLDICFSRSHPSIPCKGMVIRKRHNNTSIIGIAIEFTELDEHIVNIINCTVEENVKNSDSFN